MTALHYAALDKAGHSYYTFVVNRPNQSSVLALCFLVHLLCSAAEPLKPAQAKLATEAHQILIAHCGKCHGKCGSYSDEMLLDYAKLVGGDEPVIIMGKVDESFLYETIVEGDMPPKKAKNPVPADKLALIKRWINAGAPDWNLAPKPKREFITNEEISDRVLEDLQKQPAFDRQFIRYYTLTHLYNAGESDDAMDNYRLALSKLINSLSWDRDITKPIPIDAEKTILRIDLRDYEWTLSTWREIISRYPYKSRPPYPSFKQACELTQARILCVRVDWFISHAASPPLYHEILDLPETDKELEKKLGINVPRNLSDSPGRRVWRSGFLKSGVSKFNRVVERHKSPYGAYWKSYDFDSNKGPKNIFRNPLTFEHAGGEIIFNLPNGLQAYLLADHKGKRIDEAPVNIVFNSQGDDPVIRNGLTCMACHTRGMKIFDDRAGELHMSVSKNLFLNPENKEKALLLYPAGKIINEMVEKDNETFDNAMQKISQIAGNKEPIKLLADLYDDPLTIHEAASEAGLKESELLVRLEDPAISEIEGLTGLGSVRTISREAWEDVFAMLIGYLDLPLTASTPLQRSAKKALDEGKYDDAFKLYKDALTKEENKPNPNWGLVSILNRKLGKTCYLLGKLKLSLNYYLESHNLKVKHLGLIHYSVADSFGDLGYVCKDLEEYDLALKYADSSRHIGRQLLPAGHMDFAIKDENLALLHADMGNLNKAEELHKKALAGFKESVGSNHLLTALAHENLGAFYLLYRKDHDKALESLRKALEIYLKQKGPNHINVGQIYWIMGTSYINNKKNLIEAKRCLQKALPIFIKSHGADGTYTKSINDTLKALDDVDAEKIK